MNVRKCRQCGKMVDFDEPWCDHETMEESAWLDLAKRLPWAANSGPATMSNAVVDEIVEQAAEELGMQAGETWKEQMRTELDNG